MSAHNPAAAFFHPTSDGARVLFEVICDGERVECAISLAALQEVSGRRCYKSAELLACFATAQTRIAAAAVAKRRSRGADHAGRLNLWADDLESLPGAEGDMPLAARAQAR
jgi:hypothetical protein